MSQSLLFLIPNFQLPTMIHLSWILAEP